MKYTPEELRTALRAGPVKVSFTKLSGKARKGKFTLREANIPKNFHASLAAALVLDGHSNSDMIVAFDIKKNDWRTFFADRVDSAVPVEAK